MLSWSVGAGLERLSRDRILQIHDAIFRIEVGRLGDSGVDLTLADRVELLRNSVIAHNDDVARFASRMKHAFTLSVCNVGARKTPPACM